MKVGDLVRHRPKHAKKLLSSEPTGVVIEMTEKKVARLTEENKVVNWNEIQPEPHAVVIWGNGKITVPVSELEVVIESD
tara:strand:- start:712 stop:948 length:237 start_codon:yes stop_codon:yes gene_type:complete